MHAVSMTAVSDDLHACEGSLELRHAGRFSMPPWTLEPWPVPGWSGIDERFQHNARSASTMSQPCEPLLRLYLVARARR